MTESYKTESYKTESYKTESYNTESYKTESYKTESYKTESYNTESYKTESYKTESYKTESYKTESYNTESYKTKSYKNLNWELQVFSSLPQNFSDSTNSVFPPISPELHPINQTQKFRSFHFPPGAIKHIKEIEIMNKMSAREGEHRKVYKIETKFFLRSFSFCLTE
jgi:hypothetical protein